MCHLDQMLPIKPDPRAELNAKNIPSGIASGIQHSGMCSHGEKSRSGVGWSLQSLVKHRFVGIRHRSLPNLIRLKEIVGRLTILYICCSAEPYPALMSQDWDWSRQLVRVCSRTGMKHLYACPTCHIYGDNYRETALRHTSRVIYGLLTLFSNNFFQILQQI